MNEAEREAKRYTDFIRRYLGLPKNFFHHQLGKTEAERLWLVSELVNDWFVLEYFNRLPHRTRQEVRRQYELTLKSTGQMLKTAATRPMNLGLHGFPVQSVMFATVIGALMVEQLRGDYAANPMAMIQHLEHLKDPVAHLAFYSFMAANGFTTEFLSRSLNKRESSKTIRAMRAALPYIGMSAGLMVSNLTHEVGALARTCASGLLGPRKSDVEKALMKAMKQMGQADPCDQAMAEFFNFENKIEQYVPMLISMTLSTAGATYLQIGAIRAGQAAVQATGNQWNRLTEKVSARSADPLAGRISHSASGAASGTAQSSARHFSAKAFVDFINKGPSSSPLYNRIISKPSVTRVLGIAVRWVPATWTFQGASLVVTGVAVNLAQTYAFLKLDGVIIPWMTKTWAQLWRASRVDNADVAVRKAFELNQESQWSFIPTKSCYTSVESSGGEECYEDHSADIRGPLANLQKQMEYWRLQNHARFFNGIQIWTQVLNDMVRDISVNESFYKDYVTQVFLGLRVKEKQRLNLDLTPGEQMNTTFLPFRKMELYGIEPLGHEECTGSNQATCTKPEELALTNPDEMVKLQRNRLQWVVNTVGPAFGLPTRPLPFISAGFAEDLKIMEEAQKREAQNPNDDHLDRRLKTSGHRGLLLLAQRLSQESRDLIVQSLQDLQSEDLGIVAKRLNQMNRLLRAASLAEQSSARRASDKIEIAVEDAQISTSKSQRRRMQSFDREALQILAVVRELLGNPYPITQSGVGYLYAYLDFHKDKIKDINTPREARRSGYRFERPTEIMLYQMLCGPQAPKSEPQGTSEKLNRSEKIDPKEVSSPIMASIRMFGADMTPPELNPPRLTPVEYVEVEFPNRQAHDGAFGSQRGQLCFPGSSRPFKDLYYAKLYVGGNTGKNSPTTLLDYLNSRIDAQALGDWKSKERRARSQIMNWWESGVTSAVRQTFDKLDRAFQGLLVDLVEGLHHHIVYEMSEDGQFYEHKQYKATDASRGLLNSNLQEAQLYLKILADLESVVIEGQKAVSFKDYRGKGALKAAHDDYTPQAFTPSQTELVTRFNFIVDLLNQAKVVGEKDSRRVEIPKAPASLNSLRVQAVEALEKYKESFEGLPLKTAYQKDVADLAFQGLARVVSEVSGYLLNIQLANYDALASLDDFLKNHGREDQNGPRVRTNSRFGGQ